MGDPDEDRESGAYQKYRWKSGGPPPFAPSDKAEGWVPVRLESEDGALVAEAHFLVALKRS